MCTWMIAFMSKKTWKTFHPAPTDLYKRLDRASIV